MHDIQCTRMQVQYQVLWEAASQPEDSSNALLQSCRARDRDPGLHPPDTKQKLIEKVRMHVECGPAMQTPTPTHTPTLWPRAGLPQRRWLSQSAQHDPTHPSRPTRLTDHSRRRAATGAVGCHDHGTPQLPRPDHLALDAPRQPHGVVDDDQPGGTTGGGRLPDAVLPLVKVPAPAPEAATGKGTLRARRSHAACAGPAGAGRQGAP